MAGRFEGERVAEGPRVIVYALVDPRDGQIRYVGKSFRSAHRRLRRHLAPCYLRGSTHKERWLRVLLSLGLEPQVVVLEQCESADALSAAERAHIERLRCEGADLTNASDGGEGGSGPHTAESKEKIRRALTGKPKSATHRLRSGLASRGRRASDETRARLRALHQGKPGPVRRGVQNGRAKLSETQVREIRRLRGVVSQRALAQQFGVSKAAVRFAQTGKNWRHLR